MKDTQAQQSQNDSKSTYSKPTLKQEGSVDKVTLVDVGGSYTDIT